MKFNAIFRACRATSSGLLFLSFATDVGSFLIDVVVEEVKLELDVVEAGEDGTADGARARVWSLSAGPSNCQSIPCFILSCAKLSLRACRSSFDLRVFSG